VRAVVGWTRKYGQLRLTRSLIVAFVTLLVGISFSASHAGAQLDVAYGPNGIQQLSFNGSQLEDLGQYPSDAFHILHMKMTDLQGNLLTQGQYGWGETNNGRTWNATTETWVYNFVWGSIQVQFVQSANNLNMVVTE
jgi:hypothetical protein